GNVKEEHPAGGVAHRAAILVLGGALGGARAARRRHGDQPDPGMDQRPAQFLAQRLLQLVAELRQSGVLLSDRPVRAARRRLHPAARLWDLSAADAADPLAALDDRRLSARMA